MIFCFGEYLLDEERFELRHGGAVVPAQHKALEVLLYLVRHHGRAVPKAELLAAVWPDARVTEGSLARAVSLARESIGDRGRHPPVIATVPRHGYRFEAPVRELPGAAPARPIQVPVPPCGSRYVGRAALLGRLMGKLQAALGGDPRILLLAGEAGIGKTRTAELLVEHAREAGALVATSWHLEEGAPPHESWVQVLRAVVAEAPGAFTSLAPASRTALSRLLPELGIEAFDEEGARGDEAERAALFEAVRTLLAMAARARPVALVLDDLHAAEAESIRLLEFLGQTLAAAPVVVIATVREEDALRSPPRAHALARLMRLTAVERWPLAGLDAKEIGEFLCAQLGVEPDPALAEALEELTAGNPLLMGESLRSLEARDLLRGTRERVAWQALLPRGIRHLLLPKLRRLSPGAAHTLAHAAAIGSEIDRDLLEACLPDASRLDEALAESLDLALLHVASTPEPGLRFAHALVRQAIYEELVPPGDRRRAVHARIATALERGAISHESSVERAHHACEAVPLVVPALAIDLARRAGEQAAGRLAFEQAAGWYARALALLPQLVPSDDALRIELLLGLGGAQARGGIMERARTTYREAADEARRLGRSELLATAALGLAHRPSSTGRTDSEAIELLEDALRVLATNGGALRIRVLSRLAVELRYHDRCRAEALMEEAIAAARRGGDALALAQTLDDASFLRWSPADTEGWIALNLEIEQAARACGSPELVLAGQRGLLTGSLELGDMTGVSRALRACERTAEALRTPQARWYCAALRAMTALKGGDLRSAEQHVNDALALGERIDSDEVMLELGIQRTALLLEQGRAGDVEATVRAQVERFPEATAWRAGLARVLVAAGRHEAARAELGRLGRRRFTDVPRDRNHLPALAMAAEVACALADGRAAEALEPLLLPHARLHVVSGSGLLYYGAVHHALGLVAGTRAQWHAAIAHFESALAAEEAAAAPLWAARTRIALAHALLARARRGDRARAAAWARAGLVAARAGGWADVEAAGSAVERSLWSRRQGMPSPSPRRRTRKPEP